MRRRGTRTPEPGAAWGPAFAAYLREFDDCLGQERTREPLHTYGRGLLSPLPRTSVEPIALAAGTAVRTLQEFLRDHVCDQDRMRNQLPQQRARRPPPDTADDLGCVGLVDETGTVKKGTKTPGVQRQWCGAVGKTENGEVKYFVSNAPADTPLERWLRVAFRRGNVASTFRVNQTEIQ